MCKVCDKNFYNNEQAISENDHRYWGKYLNLFTFDEFIGIGFPIWLEKGNIIKEIITKYINNLQIQSGIKMVKTPILGSKQLYELSGHWQHYKENIFPEMNIENKEYVLRPMTCPHHILLAKKSNLSYKDLPLAFGENAMLYRYEYSGGLLGLERVRSMELIDTHIFCSNNHIAPVIEKFCHLIFHVIDVFKIQLHSINLSVRDKNNKEKFFDDDELWNKSEKQLDSIFENIFNKLLKSKKIDVLYTKDVGGAAFYGPKIDFQIKTNHNKEITLSTIQLDFLLAHKFDLTFINAQQINEHPVIIHLGIIGTLERFIAYLLERYSGDLPFWLTPVQIIIIPINVEQHREKCQELKHIFINKGIRAETDLKDHRFNKKIFNAQKQKIPYQILIGDNELNSLEFISYKKTGSHENQNVLLQKFIEMLLIDNLIH